MQQFDLYQDIATRTNGDIYVGVVGPVRAGKSTFISKFMQSLVIPAIQNKYVKDRALDEMPQAADGKAIMTTQPKFVPSEAVCVKLRDNIDFKVRMVDCVGYVVDGATGHRDGAKPRLVRTPWSDGEIPFEMAAEIGTKKVINEHSTIGVCLTCDGSIGTELTRASYQIAEERVVNEMKQTGKPFVIVLNSSNPAAAGTQKLKNALCEKYQAPVLALDVMNMSLEDINTILESVLFEFPLQSVEVKLPKWMQTLDRANELIDAIMEQAIAFSDEAQKMSDYALIDGMTFDPEKVEEIKLDNVSLGEGKIVYTVTPKAELFWEVLSTECGTPLGDDFQLMAYMRQLVVAKREYEKLKNALEQVEETGYGVVHPTLEQMVLDEPEIVKQGGRFGVRLRASAPSLHIMKVDINTEINPVVGTEQQSEELVKSLLSEFENDTKGLWETQIFGKTLHKLVKEGLNNKLTAMPHDAQLKMRKALSRMINENRGGVVCILL